MIRLRLARFVNDDRYGCPVNRVSVIDPLALQTPVVRGLRGCRQLAFSEPVELGDVIEDQCQVVRVVQQVLLERGRERRQPLVESREGLLGSVIQTRTGL